MTRALSMEIVVEQLQQVLHNLVDLSRREGKPFDGAVINGIPLFYRDEEMTMWRVSAFPADRPDPEPETAEEITAP